MTPIRPSRSGLALAHIRALLDANLEQPEWRLPSERDLVEKTGAGRRAVRVALEVLEAEGRLWRHQGRGTFAGQRPDIRPHLVATIADRTSPLEVMEARLEIEPGLARLAAAKASPEVLSSMRLILRRLGASEDHDSIERWDGAFHRLIAETAGNRLLLTIFDIIDHIRSSPSWQRPRALARNTDRLKTTQMQHAAIVDAIGQHDGAEAERTMRHHLLTLQSNLQQVLLGRRATAPEPSLSPES
ncbi:FadR/GntR family transcriptional regulator [Methylocapsa sp. S129]|uniref:FadR/GntR family transcriptional regulator n=1 Tax=Methylocapsa sp. S129 TaxID=1641869 RepID=UPI00131E5197|nr:FCD domain-containing protein [Methylocapsa sp. S129]